VTVLAYTPFVTPLPIWDWWLVTLIPLCLGVAIVYKAMKTDDLSKLPKQSLLIALWIVGGMGAAAVALAILVRIL
jgi:hypothetical protein